MWTIVATCLLVMFIVACFRECTETEDWYHVCYLCWIDRYVITLSLAAVLALTI